MPRYVVQPELSRVWIEARSSLHPIQGEAVGLEGELVLDVSDGAPTFVEPPQGSVELRVERLASGNSLYDKEMMRRVDSRRFPKIRGVVTDAVALGEGRTRLTGDFTFHGVTHRIQGDVVVTHDGNGTVVLEARHTFDVTQFGVQPPKVLMFRVHPDVDVRIRLVAIAAAG